MAGPYDGVHQFLFIPRARPELITAIEGKVIASLRVRDALVSKTVFAEGELAGLLHVAKDAPADLGVLHDELWDAGVQSDWETEGVVYKDGAGQTMGPRRHSPKYGAICRVRVSQRPLEMLRQIGDDWGARIGFVGGSQLLRRSQLLIQLGDADRGTLDGYVRDLEKITGAVGDDFQRGIIDPDVVPEA